MSLEDVSRSDAPATVVAKVIIPGIAHQHGQRTVVSFRLDASFEIVGNHDYRVSVWLNRSSNGVRRAGDLTHDRRYAVLTRNQPAHVAIELVELA